MKNDHLDMYSLHRAALQPLLPGADAETLVKSSRIIELHGDETFLKFLNHHGLGPVWHEILHDNNNTSLFSDNFAGQLHRYRLAAASRYLQQKDAMEKLRYSLDDADIPHIVFKGAHTRELLYSDPSCRVTSDIDILVSEASVPLAAKILIQSGYKPSLSSTNIGHEATFSNGPIHIDLHWDIMRTGRTRVPITNILLDERVDYSTHWGPTAETCLYLMLVHPVFTKYASSRNSKLNLALDILMLAGNQSADWEQVNHLATITGNKTAAWIMLYWLNLLAGFNLDIPTTSDIKPSYIRQRYFEYWIRKNYSDKLLSKPALIHLLFTLPAHDTLKDSWHALVSALHEKLTASSKIDKLSTELQLI